MPAASRSAAQASGVEPSARAAFTSAPPATSAATARASRRWTASISPASGAGVGRVSWAGAGATATSAATATAALGCTASMNGVSGPEIVRAPGAAAVTTAPSPGTNPNASASPTPGKSVFRMGSHERSSAWDSNATLPKPVNGRRISFALG